MNKTNKGVFPCRERMKRQGTVGNISPGAHALGLMFRGAVGTSSRLFSPPSSSLFSLEHIFKRANFRSSINPSSLSGSKRNESLPQI